MFKAIKEYFQTLPIMWSVIFITFFLYDTDFVFKMQSMLIAAVADVVIRIYNMLKNQTKPTNVHNITVNTSDPEEFIKQLSEKDRANPNT